jgi:hypothetical protein
MPRQPEDTIPPEAQEGDIRLQDGSVYGPGSVSFAKVKGLQNFGATTVDQFVQDNADAFADLQGPLLRVVQAVSVNEGKLEGLNTWDSAYLSYGVFQWTAGAGNDPGELAGLLDRVRSDSADLFQKYFGAYGLGVEMQPAAQGSSPKGFIVLNGERLDEPQKKVELRKPVWGYRFWRAAYDSGVRRAQVLHAMSRIGLFYETPQAALFGRRVCDFVTSEYGVALLLDEHVNRPAHVPSTLAEAIKSFMARPGKADTTAWTTEDEAELLELYLKARGRTDMTDSQKRAETLKADSRLSKVRTSFIA